MGDRAFVHITIGGSLLREHLEALAGHAENYDLRVEWEGEPFDSAALADGAPLELYGTELKDGQISDIDAFCAEHGLPVRRWSGGCLGAFLAEIALFGGQAPMRDYTTSEDKYLLFPSSWILGFKRLRELKREIARAELTITPFVLA